MKQKWGRVVILLLIYLFIVIALSLILDYAIADGYYVLCTPEAEVNIRAKPKLKSEIVACYFFASEVKTDGKEENGWIHVTDINGEVSEGWIYKGLLVEDVPVASPGRAQVYGGRVACRKYANGKIIRYLEDGSSVQIYAISDEWCVTEYGYIRTEFLTVNAPAKGGRR